MNVSIGSVMEVNVNNYMRLLPVVFKGKPS